MHLRIFSHVCTLRGYTDVDWLQASSIDLGNLQYNGWKNSTQWSRISLKFNFDGSEYSDLISHLYVSRYSVYTYISYNLMNEEFHHLSWDDRCSLQQWQPGPFHNGFASRPAPRSVAWREGEMVEWVEWCLVIHGDSYSQGTTKLLSQHTH